MSTATIRTVAYSPDGREIATAGVDGLIKIWSAESGEELRTLRTARRHPIWSIAYRPDGKRLVSSGLEFSLHVCDPRGNPDFHVRYGDAYFLAVSPNGSRIVTGGQYADGGATVWGLRTNTTFDAIASKPRFTFTGHSVRGLTFGTDGRRDATCGERGDFAAPIVPGKPFDISTIGDIKIWNAETGQEEQSIREIKGGVQALAFGPGDKLLAYGCKSGKVVVWNVAEKKEAFAFDKHKSAIAR